MAAARTVLGPCGRSRAPPGHQMDRPGRSLKRQQAGRAGTVPQRLGPVGGRPGSTRSCPTQLSSPSPAPAGSTSGSPPAGNRISPTGERPVSAGTLDQDDGYRPTRLASATLAASSRLTNSGRRSSPPPIAERILLERKAALYEALLTERPGDPETLDVRPPPRPVSPPSAAAATSTPAAPTRSPSPPRTRPTARPREAGVGGPTSAAGRRRHVADASPPTRRSCRSCLPSFRLPAGLCSDRRLVCKIDDLVESRQVEAS